MVRGNPGLCWVLNGAGDHERLEELSPRQLVELPAGSSDVIKCLECYQNVAPDVLCKTACAP